MTRRVLVVDDSKSVRMMVVVMLRRSGFEVVESDNGAEGMRLLETSPVDVVITDLNMPVMDGLEMIRTMRARTSTASVPALLMTTDPDESLEQARSAGASGYIVKPVSPDQLLGAVNRLVPAA